jgi:hypothetical protein
LANAALDPARGEGTARGFAVTMLWLGCSW